MVSLVFVPSFWCPVIWILWVCLYFLRQLFWVSFSLLCWSFLLVQIAFVHLKCLSCTISIIFTVSHFVIFCLSLVVVCYVLTVVCHTAVNNLFGLLLKVSSLQLYKVKWPTLPSKWRISTDRSVSGCVLQGGNNLFWFYLNTECRNFMQTQILSFLNFHNGSDGFDL